MSFTIKFKRGTASEWNNSAAPSGVVLALGEPGYEKDTGKLKIGNGTHPWALLPYVGSGADDETVRDLIATFIQNGSGISVIHDDSLNTLTIHVTGLNSSYISDFNEAVDDRVGSGLFIGGTGVLLSYNDVSNSFTVSTTGVSLSGHTHDSSDITNFASSVSGLLPTIANSGDNRILTSTGSINGINAESNLTFDGTTLSITGAITVDNLKLDGNTLSSTNSNGNIIISPSGYGALQRDSGGNTRGQYAIDLQTDRAFATMIAQGNYSILAGGANNRAGADYSCVFGGRFNNIASDNEFSSILGGYNNFIPVGEYCSIIGGQYNTANHNNVFILGSNITSTQADTTYVQNLICSATGNFASLQINGTNFDSSVSGLFPVIANSGNNRLLTSTGTTTGINGESNLTFDGSLLNVIGSGNFYGNISGLLLNIDNLIIDNNTISSTSGNIIIYPSGSGAIQRDFIGDQRGEYAIDWQAVRTSGNQVAAGNFSVICGGLNNLASSTFSVIGGGANNTSIGSGTVVCGGFSNIASGEYSNIAGGDRNSVTGYGSTIAGGELCSITGSYSFIGGGYYNTSNKDIITIAGGAYNYATGTYSSIVGGYDNRTLGLCSNIVGGETNLAHGDYSLVGGGRLNNSSGVFSVICGGSTNSISSGSNFGIIVGGLGGDILDGEYATILNGFNNNLIDSTFSTIIGGLTNNISGSFSLVGNGVQNSVSGDYNLIMGGSGNISTGNHSSIIGGSNNYIQSGCSYGMVGGKDSIASLWGEQTYSAGQFNQIGDAETRRFILRGRDTTSSTVSLKLDGNIAGSKYLYVPEWTSWYFTIKVVGRRNTGWNVSSTSNFIGDTAIYRFEGGIENKENNGFSNCVILPDANSIKTVIHEDDAGWDCSITIEYDGNNPYLGIQCSYDHTTEDVYWVASVEVVQVKVPVQGPSGILACGFGSFGDGLFNSGGFYNNREYYELNDSGTYYYVFWNGSNWIISSSLGGSTLYSSSTYTIVSNDWTVGAGTAPGGDTYDYAITSQCPQSSSSSNQSSSSQSSGSSSSSSSSSSSL